MIYIKDYMDISALVEIAAAFGKIGNNFNPIAALLTDKINEEHLGLVFFEKIRTQM